MSHRAIIEYLSQRRCDVRSLRPKKHKGTYKIAGFPHLCPNLIVSVNRTPPRQTRPQTLSYFCPADEATTALEESKTETWFRFNCACVKLFTLLTKKSSQGNFRCSHIVTIYSFQSSFSFCDLWSMYLVKKMYIYLNTTNEHLLVTTTYILSCSE